MFADGQHLLNHVMEHRAHLLNSISTGRESSPTWMFVTIYYMSLYAAMALTRAANSALIFLDKEALIEFCGNAVPRPGGGAFLVSAFTDPLTNQSQVRIQDAKRSHFHEAVWANSDNELRKAFNWISLQSSTRSPSADELLDMRALNLFVKTKFQVGAVWPSKLRNALNYRPGYSYRSVIQHNFLSLNSGLLKPAFASLEALVLHGERAQLSLSKFADPLDSPNHAIDLLLVYGLLLEKYAGEAFDAVCKANGLTSSAVRQRSKFSRLKCVEPISILAAV